MNNPWINHKLKRTVFELPTGLNDDREIEFSEVHGHQVPALLRYWTWHLEAGSINIQEHRAIIAMIIYIFESEADM